MSPSPTQWWQRSTELGRVAAALGTLVAVVYLNHLFLTALPEYGFSFHPRSGVVVEVFEPCSSSDCPQRGDQLMMISEIPFEEFARQPLVRLPETSRAEPVELLVVRGDQERQITLLPSGRGPMESITNAAGAIALPLLFWLAGTLVVLFVRPLHQQGLLLAGLFYSFGILIAAGFSSWSHAGYSWYAVTLAGFLFAVLSIHFHLSFPSPLLRGRGWGRNALYGSGIALAAWSLLRPEKSWLSIALLATVLVSSITLIVRWVRTDSPSARQASRVMASGFVLGTAPFLFLAIAPSLAGSALPKTTTPIDGLLGLVALGTLPVWPGAYLYAVHRGHDSSLKFRANRLLGAYGFYSILVATCLSLQLLLVNRLASLVDPAPRLGLLTVILVSTTTLLIVLAPSLREGFQRWVDRSVFGLRYQPVEVLPVFARKIPAVGDQLQLREVIRAHILPTLMIRRSAVYLVDGDATTELFSSHEQQVPTPQKLMELLDNPDRRLHQKNTSWVRQVLPLQAGDELLGAWLLGDRDPDDLYSTEDLALLESIANMIAAVVSGQRAALAKSRFLSNVSHELRTPLNGVLGNLDLLENSDLSTGQRTSLLRVRDCSEDLVVLIDELLALTRTDAVDLKSDARPFDLRRVARRVLRSLEERAKTKSLDLHLDYPDALPDRFIGETYRIERLLRNYVTNAVKFTDKGEVRVEVKAQTTNDLALVRVEVTDTGIGIPADQTGQIFERFTQVDSSSTRRYGGAGVGLAICKRLANSMGGSVGVESNLGAGSCFWFELPLSIESGRESTAIATAMGGLTGHRILLVEDNLVNQLVTSKMLTLLECEVVTANDGLAALELLRNDTFDLVLMDCQMPNMDGLEATVEYRSQETKTDVSRLPIVALTAHGLPEDIDQCVASGMDEVLVKPVGLVELRASLQRWLASPAN